MSIASELNNYRNGLDDAWDAAEDMGATIPHDRNMVNLDDAIRTIPVSSPNDGVLTITQNGVTVQTFSADQATNVTAALTDTTYSAMTGASSGAAGTSGLVPAPAAGDEGKFLQGDGTWATPTDTTYTAGTNVQISAQNVISATDTTYSAMTGATASTAGASGLVPAPAAGENAEVLYGDGTWKLPGMTILKYGTSTYAEALAAYKANNIIYTRASSNASNPGTGDQLRMAFLAYVNNEATPTEFEFQYYRSVSTHSDSTQGDEVFVYKLKSSTGWEFTKRNAYSKVAVDSSLTKTYSSGTITLKANAMTGATGSVAGTAGYVPAPAAGDEDKFLKGDGTWDAVMGINPIAITPSDYISFDPGITVNTLSGYKIGKLVNIQYDIGATLVAGQNVVGTATNKVLKVTYGPGRVTDWNNNTQGVASIVIIPNGAVRIYTSQAGTASAGDVWFFEA